MRVEVTERDFVVRNEGSVWTFQPLTDRAQNFSQTDLGLESWQWLGPVFTVDHRIAQDLVESLLDEGFDVGS